jgi:type I restriction enzyme, S subunit
MLENNLLSLSFGNIIAKDINSNDGLLPESFETYQIIISGDIVFRFTDMQNDDRSLRSAIVNQRGIITSAYMALRPFDGESEYFNYLFRTYDFIKIFYTMGGGLRQSLKFSDVKRTQILFPPIDEQKQIVKFLDSEIGKINTLITELCNLIERMVEKRKAIITRAITKGLDQSPVMKSSGVAWLGELPEHWEVRRVKSICDFTTSGPRGWSDRIRESGDLFIQSGDLDDLLHVKFETAKRVQVSEDAEAARTMVQAGDVVVCITGAKTGNVAVCLSVPETAYVNQHLCLIRPSKDVIPMYLGLFLKSEVGQTYFEFSQYGLKQGLSLDDVRDAPVFLPSIAEQIAIVEFIESETTKIDALVFEAGTSIALLQEHRSALITAVVTGKVDVREVACV